jgi:hypothetical protein
VKHNGINFRVSHAYGWRCAEAGDMTRDGRDMLEAKNGGYIVIVRKDDCPTVIDERGRKCYSPKGVKQAVRLDYGGTYYGYGATRKVNDGPWRWVRAGRPCHYVQATKYEYTEVWMVRDGRVYRGRIYRLQEDDA